MTTRHEIRSRVRHALVALSLVTLLGACADNGVKDPATAPVVERTYVAPFEDIERAIKQVMVKYPIRIDNLDAGIFETDFIKGDLRWKPPQKDITFDAGYRYRILLHVLHGKSEKRPTTKVVVNKVIEQQSDFFSDADQVGSDGLEERVILYRIGRELAVDRSSKRSQDKQNQDARKGFQ